MTNFVQTVLLGLLNGGLYALIAFGLVIVFDVTRVLNLAHGEFLTLGMYVGAWSVSAFNIDAYLASLITVPTTSILAVLAYVVLRYSINGNHMTSIGITVGLLFVVQNLALFLFTADSQSIQSPFRYTSLEFWRIVLPLPQLIGFLVSVIAMTVLYLVLQKTRLGLRLRSVASNPEAAQLAGINVARLHLLSFAIGGGCAGLASSLLLSMRSFSPTTGSDYILTALSIVILGGLGSFPGALIGALIIGLGEALGNLYLPGSFGPVIGLVCVMLSLLLRPQGLLGRQ